MIKLGELAGGALKGKLRLYLEYALIAAIVALAALVTYNYVQRLRLDTKVATLEGKVDKANERVKEVEEVNRQQADAIDTIRSIRDVDGTILAGLAKDMDALRVRDTSMTTRLATLERSNEAVKRYLNSAVPEPVGCVLDQTCPPDGDGVPATQRGAARKVPAAKPAPKPNQR